MHRAFPALVALVAFLASALPAAAEELVQSDDWYAVYVNGTKSGHARTRVLRIPGDDRDLWQTESDTTIVVNKGGGDITLKIASVIVEDADGRVNRFTQSQDVGGQVIRTEGVVTGESIAIDQNGVAAQDTYPAGALGPAATDRKLAATGLVEGAEVAVLTFSTDYPGDGARMRFTVGGTRTRTVIDRNLVLHRITVSNERSSAKTHEMWLDGAARMHISESDVPGLGELRMVRTTEQLARSMTTAAEIASRALITPDRGIEAPRRTKHVVLRFARDDGERYAANIPTDAQQTIGDPDEAGARLVTIREPTLPVDVTLLRRPITDPGPELEPYLAESAYLEIGDERVQALAERAVGDETNALICARRIEETVRSFVSDKSLDVGFATAAEVARTGEGDCSEHAVLAAALARAVGLPSRVVTGIVYVPAFSMPGAGPRGAFGYHMWTEVLVAKDRWLPIDAALGAFDATHVALGRSDLSAQSPAAGMYRQLMSAIADLRIDVVVAR